MPHKDCNSVGAEDGTQQYSNMCAYSSNMTQFRKVGLGLAGYIEVSNLDVFCVDI